MADAITSFAGSMLFICLHAAAFTVWMLFFESTHPVADLTLLVSLKAIFLSTFVMIGQNRQSALQQAKADRDFLEQETRRCAASRRQRSGAAASRDAC